MMLVAVVSSFFGGLPGWISHFAGLKLGIISEPWLCVGNEEVGTRPNAEKCGYQISIPKIIDGKRL